MRQSKPNLASVTTINPDGSRHFLYPADVRGKWSSLRKLVALLLIIIYVSLPWVTIGGHPAVFLDVERRSFHLFGYSLPTQDMWVLFFLMAGMGFGLFVVTSLLGRLWCGWACPYTVFLDHVYRRIERWIEGDAVARKALRAAPWSPTKLLKFLTKQSLYLAMSWLIAHVFLAYFVSLRHLYHLILDGPLTHATVFGFVTLLTLILWFCFGYFREQFCIVLCPYGRLQSALTDDDTINIGYDAARGDPRGPKDKVAGHCIDCNRCVQVCPTGIDIRNGLQLECIGCTACIDACDEVMTRLQRPTGLIRYDSYNAFHGNKRRFLRPRIYVYTVFTLLGITAFALMISYRLHPFYVGIAKTGSAGPLVDATGVRNIYKLQLINKLNQPVQLTVDLAPTSPQGYQISGGKLHLSLQANEEISRKFIVEVPLSAYQGITPLTFTISSNQSDQVVEKNVTFTGPTLQSLKKAP